MTQISWDHEQTASLFSWEEFLPKLPGGVKLTLWPLDHAFVYN